MKREVREKGKERDGMGNRNTLDNACLCVRREKGSTEKF